MDDLAATDRPNLRVFDGDDGSRATVERYELDLVGFSVLVYVDDGTDIARYQRLFRDRLGEDDSVKFEDHVP